MKKPLIVVVACMSVSAHGAIHPPSRYTFAGDIQFAHFCQAILQDDLSLLRKSVKQQVGELATTRRGVLKRLVSKGGVTCDGSDLLEFSRQRDASQVYAYLKDEL